MWLQLVMGIAAAFVILAVIFGLGLARNERTFKHRMNILDRIFKADPALFWQLMDVYHGVSYDDMMLKFWKPLNSFYPTEFLNLLPK